MISNIYFRFFNYDGGEGMSALKHLFDLSYQILLVVIMASIITGIIINTFQDIKDTNEKMAIDKATICSICSLPKSSFETNATKFESHIKNEHYAWNYLVCLCLIYITVENLLLC